MYLGLEEILLLLLLFFLLLLLSLQYNSLSMKNKKTWILVSLVSLLWIAAISSFQDVLRLILPYILPVLGIVTILLYAIEGVKATIHSKQKRIDQQIRSSQPTLQPRKRKPPPSIQLSDEQKCPQCNIGILRLISEKRETPTPPKDPQFLYVEYNVWVRKRTCKTCGYELTERELPGGRRFFRDNEGNIWNSLF